MLLLLFAGGLTLAQTITELVASSPSAVNGFNTQRTATTGTWRFALEIADPAAETGVVWHDVTQFYVGDHYERGADEYMGDFKASVAQVMLQADDDALAPWGQDTSPLFGVDVPLDAGLLMRASMFRVVDGTTVEWDPIWTGTVDTWGDASQARGQVRTHTVTVVDTIADLVNVPVLIDTTIIEDTPTLGDWFEQLLTQATWLYGVDMYGDWIDGLPYPGSDTQYSAINLMDAATEPLGLVWRSLRSGKMVIHPAPWDTTSTERYDNPLLDVYPDGLKFSYAPDTSDIEYITDDDQQPFGIQRTAAGVLNSFQVTMPDGFSTEVYLADDPVSMAKYRVRPFTATWLANNPPAVDDLLAARAYASRQALPLRTTLDHEGFWAAMVLIDHLDPVTIVHATSDTGPTVIATGTVRKVIEDRTFRGEDADGNSMLSWQSTVQVDLDASETAAALLPVEDLTLVDTDSPLLTTTSTAEFSWTNPTQPSITPTDVQMRVLGRSTIWYLADYPGVGADGVTIGGLEAGARYTFEVRLVRRVNGIITNFSATRRLAFQTPFRIYPHPVPGDDPTDTNGEFPEGPDDCGAFSVELQENDGSGWSTVDTFSGAELTDNGDGTFSLTTDIPNSFFNEGSMYRFVTLCDGDIVTVGPEFDPPDDWSDPCTTPPALTNPPYSLPSLTVYIPKVCAPDIIREAVSGIEAVKGDAFDAILSLISDPNQRALSAIDDPAWSDTPGIVAYGECPQIAGVTGDKTIGWRGKIPDAATCVLFECAAMRINCAPTATKWRASVTVYKVGSTITLATATELDLDTEYKIDATHDLSTGDIQIFVDDVLDNSVGGTDNIPTVSALPIWRVGATPGGYSTDCALWDEVVAIGVPPASVTVTINQASGQADPTTGSSILFDVVFSEAVSGFATGDVTLSGTAGGTLVGTVTGSGSTYTVTVTGMSTSGTVIATIGAAKCTGDISGLPNDASTSTDNTVSWVAVGLADYALQLRGGGSYPLNDLDVAVSSADFLLISNMYRGGGASSAPSPLVDTSLGVALSGVTSIYASANFDTLGASRGSARLDRATAAATGTMISNQLDDCGQVIMHWHGISGAPVQTNRSTADATDSCNISLASPPTGLVIVIIQYGGTIGTFGSGLSPAAPANWTKLIDERWNSSGSKGVLVFKATAQQTFTYSLASGITAGGGRDVIILEY